MPYYCLQITMSAEEQAEEQLLEYFQDLGISFLEVLCHDKVSDPHFEAMVFAVTLLGTPGSTVQGRVSIQTSCYVPNDAWLDCTGPLSLDTNITKAELAPQLVSETGQPLGSPSDWMNLPL